MPLRMQLLALTAVIALLGTAGIARADRFQDKLDKLIAGLPKDAAAFVTRRAWCNHWSNADPSSKSRARLIDREMRWYGCVRINDDEAILRHRYGADPKVIKALNDAQDF